MKKTFIALLTLCACLPAAWSQDRIYRCGNEYTNNATQAKERGCKVVEGGNVTVLQSSRPAAAPWRWRRFGIQRLRNCAS